MVIWIAVDIKSYIVVYPESNQAVFYANMKENRKNGFYGRLHYNNLIVEGNSNNNFF